jgi:hypothetical protein
VIIEVLYEQSPDFPNVMAQAFGKAVGDWT